MYKVVFFICSLGFPFEFSVSGKLHIVSIMVLDFRFKSRMALGYFSVLIPLNTESLHIRAAATSNQ